MIHPNTQATLFPTTIAEALQIAKTTMSIASQWYENNYVSFNIEEKKELQHSEVLELVFLSKLFNSALSKSYIDFLLSKLQKPYAYNPELVYYNVFDNEWNYKPEIIDEKTTTLKFIESLDIEKDKELISELRLLLKEKTK